MSGSFFFFFQRGGKESKWDMEIADKRDQVVTEIQPAFSTVLDLSSVPDDNDWSKVRYRGPLYFDFDADGDLDLACESIKNFLGKLDLELDFDVSQARFFASGSKGFHIEIAPECFMPKVPATGTAWLPYVYRAMAESIIVDTLDLSVYTGKKGRQWRTTNVRRENGMYKVPLHLDEVMGITPDLYAELIREPREPSVVTPASLNSKFAMLFERSKDKIVTQMRGKKKRVEKANAFLDPWIKAKKTPPTIEMIMRGENLAEGAGFQSIAMQLAIYAASVGMSLSEFLDRSKGLCENHVSDSRRYGTFQRRQDELTRMYEYMQQDSLYDFDTGPVVRLVKQGTPVADLGVMETEDRDDTPVNSGGMVEADVEDGDAVKVEAVVEVDHHKNMRRGVFMNADGIFRKVGDNYESLCRATLRQVESFYDIEKSEFKGFEFDIVMRGRRTTRAQLAHEAFTSSLKLKQFFAAHQLSFQGGDADAASLLDIMSDKAARGGRVYTYPREGFFIMNNPETESIDPVKCYLTRDTFLASVKPEDSDYFRLKYRPEQATSSYNIDIHKAPKLSDEMVPALHDLFTFSRPSTVADLLGWFIAAHYRSAYLYLFHQFPLLQVYGEAGSGKTQTIKLLAHLHWFIEERISIKSATSCTPFAMDAHASSSTSAPFILDEYKPRELRQHKGKYEKLKDVFKANYVGADIGERGTLNKGAETHLAIVKSRATAPIVFMGEAVEMETAIIERCVCVNLSKSYQTRAREEAFLRLQSDPTVISALGRAIVELGFQINLTEMRKEVRAIQAEIAEGLPDFDDEQRKRVAPRLIYNRAVVTHALRTLKHVLAHHFGSEFDKDIALITEGKSDQAADEQRTIALHGMSEISKVMSRVALMSRDKDKPWEMRPNIDYFTDDMGGVEMKVEAAYDKYRFYCAAIRDTPLFDTIDAFVHALNAYSPVTDRVCSSSALRQDGSTERIVRFNAMHLRREGVGAFKSD